MSACLEFVAPLTFTFGTAHPLSTRTPWPLARLVTSSLVAPRTASHRAHVSAWLES